MMTANELQRELDRNARVTLSWPGDPDLASEDVTRSIQYLLWELDKAKSEALNAHTPRIDPPPSRMPPGA